MTESDLWKKNVCVGQYASLLNGFAFPSEGFTDNDGTPLIRIRDLRSLTTEINFRGSFDTKYLVRRGDILIGMDGDFDTVKWKGDDALLNQRVCKLESKDPEKMVQDFLFYRIIEEVLRINRITAATTVKHLSSGDVLGITIDLPSKPEQTKIAEILSTLDCAIEQTEALIAKQQRIKTGLMQDLLTKGIDEHGNIRSETTHAFKDSALGRIPVEWDVSVIEDVAKITTGDKDTQDRDDSAQYPFFVRSQTVERIDSYSFDGEAILTAGDGVGVGKVFHYFVGKFDYHQRVYCIHSFSECISGYFLFQYFRQNFISRVAQFSAKGSVDSVRREMIAKMPIPLPSIDEQQNIGNILRNAEDVQAEGERTLGKLHLLKRGLMHDLLTGERRVAALLAQAATQ